MTGLALRTPRNMNSSKNKKASEHKDHKHRASIVRVELQVGDGRLELLDESNVSEYMIPSRLDTIGKYARNRDVRNEGCSYRPSIIRSFSFVSECCTRTKPYDEHARTPTTNCDMVNKRQNKTRNLPIIVFFFFRVQQRCPPPPP